jgi:transposase-like protein
MVDLIEQSRMACDQLIDVAGRAVLNAVLQLSAAQMAGGPPQQGKRRLAGVVFYGRQAGQAMLSDRKVEVERPRLRRKGRGGKEVEIPAYTAMQNQSPLGGCMLDTLLRGVSTRNYKDVIPQMAETVGVSKSSVSRQAIEASEAELEALLSRRFDDLKLLIIYIDGVVFGEHTMIGAVDVDTEGHKHVLGIREGATENATVVTELLQNIVARGVDPKQRRLFIIDGSKALRAAINAVFGADQPVQRCRAHKLRNVLDHLPEEQKEQVKNLMRAAWKMEWKAGMARIRKLAEWLEREYPSAAASLREGLEEFHHQPAGCAAHVATLPGNDQHHRKPARRMRIRTRRVTNWQNGSMVRRWLASAFLRTEKSFRRIMGYCELWTLGTC